MTCLLTPRTRACSSLFFLNRTLSKFRSSCAFSAPPFFIFLGVSHALLSVGECHHVPSLPGDASTLLARPPGLAVDGSGISLHVPSKIIPSPSTSRRSNGFKTPSIFANDLRILRVKEPEPLTRPMTLPIPLVSYISSKSDFLRMPFFEALAISLLTIVLTTLLCASC